MWNAVINAMNYTVTQNHVFYKRGLSIIRNTPPFIKIHVVAELFFQHISSLKYNSKRFWYFKCTSDTLQTNIPWLAQSFWKNFFYTISDNHRQNILRLNFFATKKMLNFDEKRCKSFKPPSLPLKSMLVIGIMYVYCLRVFVTSFI